MTGIDEQNSDMEFMKMISDEVIIDRSTVKKLVDSLSAMLSNDDYYQFKIRITNCGTITIIPHSKPVEISRTEETSNETF